MQVLRFINTISQDSGRSLAFTIALTAFAGSTALLLVFVQKPYLLNLLFPASALAIGVWLFATRLPLFFGFMWLLWFFSPFIRRVIDYAAGGYNPSPLPLLAPLLVVVLCAFTLAYHGGLLTRSPYRGVGLAVLGVILGLVVGLPKLSPITLVQALLEWIGPLLLCFHLLVYQHLYKQHRRVMLAVIAVAAALMGGYGIYQYFVLPPWDRMWMVGADMASIGFPYPQEVRVFSTLNSPGPFGMVMAALLLMLFADSRIWTLAASVPGYIGWMLAVVRASWVGWGVGVVFAIFTTHGAMRRRLLFTLVFTALLAVPVILQTSAINETVSGRMETLANVEEDGSFQGRASQYSHLVTMVAKNPLGRGIGTIYFDSGWVTIFYQLGLLGGLLYCAGLALMIRDAWSTWRSPTDTFSKFTLAAGSMLVFLMLAGSQQVGPVGCLMWSFLALTIVAGWQSGAAPQNE
jgi:hypothetical protein